MTRDTFAEIRARLDVRDLAKREGLDGRDDKQGRLHFTCPICGRTHKAMSADGAGWHCVACGQKGDAVDLLAAVRGLDAGEALRVAKGLAGILDDDRARWTPPPPRRQPPPLVVLSPDDAAARTRALRLAALHYGYLGGWHRDDDTPSPGEHLAHLQDFAGLPDLEAARTKRDATAVRAYGGRRLAALDGRTDAQLAALVGAAPCARSGLREFLAHHGADVDAAVRAGLLRADGSEVLAGRLVYVWTDARGGPVYLTGRAIADDQQLKVYALPVHGAGADPTVGVPRPGVPFALAAALAVAEEHPDLPILVAEGELDALALLSLGWPAVATGGTSRTPAATLAACLAGHPVRVVFDFGEADPAKQAQTDARAEDTARELRALGCDALTVPSAAMREALAAAGGAA